MAMVTPVRANQGKRRALALMMRNERLERKERGKEWKGWPAAFGINRTRNKNDREWMLICQS